MRGITPKVHQSRDGQLRTASNALTDIDPVPIGIGEKGNDNEGLEADTFGVPP